MIAELIDGKGERQYGLGSVNQRAHALNRAAGGTVWLRSGVGHRGVAARHRPYGARLGEDPAADGVDDLHEERGHAFLARYFGPEVTEPVRLHVAAKRYLCATEPDYFNRLTADSVRSLTLQGGPMSAEEASAFAAQPQAKAAVQLRRFDEAAKVKGLPTPPVDHFLPHVRACLR